MKYAVTMPSLGADMDEGKLLEWHIRPGDVISKGQLIAAVETQKAAVDIESFRAGTVLELVGNIDDAIRVGSTIAWLDVADDDVAAPAAGQAAPAAAAAPAPVVASAATHAPLPGHHRQRVSPASEKKAASLINVREAIARAMARSKREIPHYYLQSQFHIDKLVAWLDAKNRSLPPEERLFMPAVLMRAVVLALQSNPAMNGYYENGAFVRKDAIHLGITVGLKPDGVMTPAILDAHTLSLAQLNAAFSDLVQRARAGKLRNREMTDGTVTVTNVGELGADAVTGVIFPPQVALVGFGRVRKAPIVDADGGVRGGYVLDTTLAADHRVSDGLAGSRLLSMIERLLAQPDKLEN